MFLAAGEASARFAPLLQPAAIATSCSGQGHADSPRQKASFDRAEALQPDLLFVDHKYAF